MWLIYALGGGWGHLTRAVALARIAHRDRPVRILTNSPYAGIVAGALPELDILALDPRNRAEQTRAEVIRAIAECEPSWLIVDTFPRGIGGELAEVLGGAPLRSRLDNPGKNRPQAGETGENACPTTTERRASASGLPIRCGRVLVHRDLNPRYVQAVRLREFVAAHYDLVLVPGTGEGSQLGESAQTFETDPWLVRCAGEIPDGSRVKEVLRLGSHEERCVLVCASGKAEELAWYSAVLDSLRKLDCPLPVRCVAAECPTGWSDEQSVPMSRDAAGRSARATGGGWVRYWPAMDLFGCADVVVGGGGYNTVQECQAWNVPLIARPWARAYDRQELRVQRASAHGRVIVVRGPVEAARAALREIRDRPPRWASFGNGAVVAVRQIAALRSTFADSR